MRREESAATIYILKGDQFQVNYNLDGDNGANNSVRVFMVYLMPEFQGNYWVMLKAMRAAYDVLLHNGRTSMNGKCITEEEHDYPFAKREWQRSENALRRPYRRRKQASEGICQCRRN